tara:strand:+ start:1210 stop:1551 length:342 start_codon:yes stop_codon:yes gene_type:complete
MNEETRPLDDDINIYNNVKYMLTLIEQYPTSNSWLLNEGVHNIGRTKDKEIVLDDITVSRNHGSIIVDGDVIELLDNQSTNGIFLNGELIEKAVIKAGDRIQIGKFLLLLVKL